MKVSPADISDEMWVKGLGLVGGFTPETCPACGRWPEVGSDPGGGVVARCACRTRREEIPPLPPGVSGREAEKSAYVAACVRALRRWTEGAA